MGLVGGLLRAAAPLALAPLTGGASLAVVAQQVAVRAFATQIISAAAQQLGLPPQVLNTALAAFGQRSGLGGFANSSLSGFSNVQEARDWVNVLRQSGASRVEIARAEREFRTAVQDAQSEVKSFLQEQLSTLNRSNEKRKLDKDIQGVMNGKGSILMKLAMILGMVADQKMGAMMQKAKDIGAMGEIKAGNQSKFSQSNSELQALTQEFSIISNAMTNVVKSVGEAQATIARK